MTWSPITLRWPEQATQWLANLTAAQDLAVSELDNTAQRLSVLDGLATTDLSPVGSPARSAGAAGRAALTGQLAEPLACLAVTPFQFGMGQGQGKQRYLSAPNLMEMLASKLVDNDPARPAGPQCALVILFLATRYDQFAASLARFNALLPIPDLVKAEHRAGQLARLESEKWELPVASTLPGFASLSLHSTTLPSAAQRAMSAQLAALEGYAADQAPLADLVNLAGKKAAQHAAQAQRLNELRAAVANNGADGSMRARFLGPGTAAELRDALLEGEVPGHEWVLCAGLVLIGSQPGLSFVKELVGL
ncbi:hypothetical protein [Pseudomonas sp. B392_1p]|uniref:hypothetical protein n=1 Tax=Pseudomonas sp. B392_1p TaxID=3457507 RepID=UPI003FD37579